MALQYFLAIFVFIVHQFPQNRVTAMTISESKVDSFSEAKDLKLFYGQPTILDSIGMLQRSAGYADHEYYGDAVLFSPQCSITFAEAIVNAKQSPPKVDTTHQYTLKIIRPDCDTDYHLEQIFLPNAGFNRTSYNHNIAVLKTKAHVQIGLSTRCKGNPVNPAWVSCDPEGPPAEYSDCYIASFGNTNKEQVTPPDDIVPNKRQVKVKSWDDCEYIRKHTSASTTIPSSEADTICAVSYLYGDQSVCKYDVNPIMYCRYWRQPEQHSGLISWLFPSRTDGYGYNRDVQGNKDMYRPDNQDSLIAVGHLVDWYGKRSCMEDEKGADVFVKYGSQSYEELFSKCGYYCSKDLEKGYRCKGSPSPSLGPVYCKPEKISDSDAG